RMALAPPLLGVSINNRHHTGRGIAETGTFSLCIPGRGMVAATDYCGLVSGKNEDKARLFEVFYGDPPGPPMIRECPLCLELAVTRTVDLTTHSLFIGEITAAHAHADVLTDGRPDMAKIDPLLLTMHDNRYFALGEVVGAAWKDGKKLKGEKA
ncbi:MAG: flavin reductase family protein, partial [Desulfovibrio sp.]|nr:flavin reductase family protein [Desulfovibrio sp.]